MGLKEKNINKLLEYLKENKKITLLDIQALVNIKERNAKNYIKYLKEYGLNIKCERGVYFLIDKEENKGTVIDKEGIREIIISNIVGSRTEGVNKKELINRIKDSFCDKDIISEKTLIRTIKRCEEKNIIKLQKEKYKISLNISTLYKVTYEDILKFIDKCDMYNTSMPFFFQVDKLKGKIQTQCNHEVWDYYVYSLGRKYERDNFSSFFKKIDKYDYKHKKLQITYKSKIGVLCLVIEVCTFYYSWEKDKFYIVCRSDNNIILINIETIIEIQEVNESNNLFKNKKIIENIKLMFQASLSSTYKVIVEFENTFSIKNKLQRLNKSRSKSTLRYLEDKLIYEDYISGLYDFANYLRRFGRSCKVIEPIELKDIMKKTYERVLEKYEVTSYD